MVWVLLMELMKKSHLILIDSMQGGGNRPVCRYGPNCRKLQTGNCNFYHPPNQGGQQGGQGGQHAGGKPGFGGQNPN